MPVDMSLLDRAAELKRELVEYASSRRYSRELTRVLDRNFPGRVVSSELQIMNAIDFFALQYKLKDGLSPVDHYVADHPKLPEADRAMLLGWKDVVEGVFEVTGREDDALVAINLVDDLTYRLRSNMGPGVFAPMKTGSFFIGRLVPFAGDWLVSGSLSLLTKAQRAPAAEAAMRLLSAHPRLVYRNPARLEQAREMQRDERNAFIAHFGADMVVVPGARVGSEMDRFMRFRVHEWRGPDGKTPAEKQHEMTGSVAPPPKFPRPEGFRSIATVGIVYHEVEGMHFFPDYGPLVEVFEHPDLVADKAHRRLVQMYLNDPDMHPLAVRRLADPDPDRADRVLRTVLGRRNFSWQRDGEPLLRRTKPGFFDVPSYPSVIAIGGRLSELQSPSPRRKLLPRKLPRH